MRAILLAFLLVAPVAEIGMGIPAASGLKGAEWAVAVVDGDTLVLDGGGRQVRLVGIQAPKLPLGRRNFKAWSLAESSKKALERLSLGKRRKLPYGGACIDLHGCASRPICRMTLTCGPRVRS